MGWWEFSLECLNPLSFSNSPSTPFSISFCKNINLFPQGVTVVACTIHGSWKVNGILKWSNFLWLHSFSSLIFSTYTLPPWLPPLFSPVQSKPFQDRLPSSHLALVPSAFICQYSFITFTFPKSGNSLSTVGPVLILILFFIYISIPLYIYFFFHKISGKKGGCSCVWCNVFKHNFHKDFWNLILV